MKKLVLFIHGLAGSAGETWKDFPMLMRGDADLAKQYDVGAFGYDTSFFWSKPSLQIAPEA